MPILSPRKRINLASPTRLLSAGVNYISLYQRDLSRFPGLVEPRFERAVEAQESVPAFFGNGLHPVALMACRRGRAEPDVHRRVGVDDKAFPLAADARELVVRRKL